MPPNVSGDESLVREPPYKILYEERCGRLLVAARDILAGEVLFTDSPGAVGPDTNPKPVCLNCYKRLAMLVYRCRHCSAPLCSPYCQIEDGHHHRECSLFRQHGPRLQVEDFNKPTAWYNAIMVLRILWLRDNQPDTWHLLDILMDHLDLQKPPSKRKNSIVDFILTDCRLKQFSENEILHVIGILDTNAYIIGENPNKDTDLQGLFPIMSILNHSCSSNTICFTNEDFSFTCRAVVGISAGEEITTNYLHHHYHYYGTSYRLPELREFWHFHCGCTRCGDRTEGGSDVDCLLCTECGGQVRGQGHAEQPTWECSSCHRSPPHPQVREALNTHWQIIEDITKDDNQGLLEVLEKLSKLFHENHYYILEVKRRFMENVVDYEDLACAVLEKKIQFCADHLKVQAVVAPGLSEYRAYISWHLAEPLYWTAREKYDNNLVTKQELLTSMEEVTKHLLVVIQIWGPFRRRSSEWVVAEKARTLLEKIDEKYLQRGLGQQAGDVLQRRILKSYRNQEF